MYHLISSSTNLYWPSTSQYRHILTQNHQVPLIIHHLVRHSSDNWVISLFYDLFMSHAHYTWSSLSWHLLLGVWPLPHPIMTLFSIHFTPFFFCNLAYETDFKLLLHISGSNLTLTSIVISFLASNCGRVKKWQISGMIFLTDSPSVQLPPKTQKIWIANPREPFFKKMYSSIDLFKNISVAFPKFHSEK